MAAAIRSIVPFSVLPSARAQRVSLVARAVSALFGSPSFLRANGASDAGRAASVASRMRSWRKRAVPVYQIDRRGTWSDERLPRIWLSEPDCEATGEAAARRRLSVRYPCGPDRGGSKALALGERSFAWGLAANDPSEALACFQAAELLYLHAVERGSLDALTRLGALYSFDLCQGSYWRDSLSEHARHAREKVQEKAVRMLSRAAARGDAEAKWRLGDMWAAGIGCAGDQALAFNLYRGSFARGAGCTLAQIDAAATSAGIVALVRGEQARLEACGCAAARIAACFERGAGAESDPARAAAWYEAACLLLDSCVGRGSWHYEEELASASEGRMRALCGASDDAAGA